MVYPKIIFLKCQISEDSNLSQAFLEHDYLKLKESLLDKFNVDLRTMKQTYFLSEDSHSDSLTIITVDSDNRFHVNTLKGDVVQDLKDFI
jgi:hypothetical protein